MRAVGVPGNTLAALSCLVDHGGTGADLGNPKGAGKASAACEKAVQKAGASFIAKESKSLAGCVESIFACVTAKSTDASCISKAKTTCDKTFDALDTAATTLDDAVAKACAPPAVDFASLLAAEGENLGALAGECTPLGVATLTDLSDYRTCLLRQHRCQVEELLRFEMPRSAELLPMVGRSSKSAFCP